MKSTAMIIPTPSKDEITSQRSFLETIEIEDQDQDSTKKPRLDSNKELVEVEDKKIE